jgi:hypothetical protein
MQVPIPVPSALENGRAVEIDQKLSLLSLWIVDKILNIFDAHPDSCYHAFHEPIWLVKDEPFQG